MKLNNVDRDILRVLAASYTELRGLEIYDRTCPISFLWLFKRRVSFSEIFPSLKKLEALDLAQSRSIKQFSNQPYYGNPRVYEITELGRERSQEG